MPARPADRHCRATACRTAYHGCADLDLSIRRIDSLPCGCRSAGPWSACGARRGGLFPTDCGPALHSRYRLARPTGDRWFADSLLEGGGFELSVPHHTTKVSGPAHVASLQLSAGGVGAPLVDRVGLLAHARAGILRERDDRIAGDARQDRAERRRQQRTVVEHEEDVHAAEFLDVAALDRIEENDLIAAVINGLGLRTQARGVIAAAFDGAGAADRSARVVLRHPNRHRRRSAL